MTFEEKQTITYQEVLQRASSFLVENKLEAMVAEWLLRERLAWTKTDLVMNYRKEMPVDQQKQFKQDIDAFLSGKPVQQIIGHEWFFDRKFMVEASTLIPRPETEEWLYKVLETLPKDPLTVLDIGTGTGIIGITHKLERPQDIVTATDISAEALAVAQKNSEQLAAAVDYKLGDLFEPINNQKYDVILSNPPYISQDERKVMDQSVLDFEPELALFAEKDGLEIYYRLANDLQKHLNSGGCAFFEIGYKQGTSVIKIFKEQLPTAKIELWQDFSGLDRVIAIYT